MLLGLNLTHVLNYWTKSHYVLVILSVFLSSVLIWIEAIVALIAVGRKPRRMLLAITVLSIAYTLSHLIGLAWFIERPVVRDALITPLISVVNGSKSFPSDHAMIALYLAGIIIWQRKAWTWFAVLCAITIPLGRILVGVHTSVDVIGGALLGSASIILLIKYDRKWNATSV